MENPITKLNNLGVPIQRPTAPNKRQGGIVNVNYGHTGGGKLYSYRDTKGVHRAGDEVVVQVTNKAGKTYKTLGVVRSSHAAETAGAKNTENYLNSSGIALKSVSGGSQAQLPGYYPNWGKEAKAAYDLQTEYRLKGASEKEQADVKAYTSQARRESKQKYDQNAMRKLEPLEGNGDN